jgi:hypothetical protein
MKYYYVSLGINCISRKSFDKFYNQLNAQPYYIFDWSYILDAKDCAVAINNNFKNYLDVIKIKDSKNELDLEKLKILVGEDSRSKLSRKNNYLWRSNIYDTHVYYPSIVEYHYDLRIKEDKEKILRRIGRLEDLIKNKKPILFVRIIIYPIVTQFNFFKIDYVQGVKNCYEFIETLNSIENIKVLFIHYSFNPNVKKDIIKSTTSFYLDSYEIISNYFTDYWSDPHILYKFIKPILKNYDFIN